MMQKNLATLLTIVILLVTTSGSAIAYERCGTTMQIDHFLLAVPDLEEGAKALEAETGITPQFGGAHAGGATANYLFGLGNCMYLELIGANPKGVSENNFSKMLKNLPGPQLIGVAFSTADIAATAVALKSNNFKIGSIQSSGRTTPTGQKLAWKTIGLDLSTGPHFIIFFIDWQLGADKTQNHPAATAPKAAVFKSLHISAPDLTAFEGLATKFNLDFSVSESDHFSATLKIDTPKGTISYKSN